jgi:magnesium-transporting ATPase (P-type)
MSESWSKSAAAVCKELGVDPKKGLSDAQVEKLAEQHGPNELPEEEGPSGRRQCVLVTQRRWKWKTRFLSL